MHTIYSKGKWSLKKGVIHDYYTTSRIIFVFMAILPRLLHLPSRRAFTIIELLIVIAILGILATMLMMNYRGQVDRGMDVRRKTDLKKIAAAFEAYYNDKNCYPPATILQNCGGSELAPYLEKIPCDPTNIPYVYVPVDASNVCGDFRIFGTLKDRSDTDIARLGCAGGCGNGAPAGYNYGVSSGVPVGSKLSSNGQGGLGGASNQACNNMGKCNAMSDFQLQQCPVGAIGCNNDANCSSYGGPFCP